MEYLVFSVKDNSGAGITKAYRIPDGSMGLTCSRIDAVVRGVLTPGEYGGEYEIDKIYEEANSMYGYQDVCNTWTNNDSSLALKSSYILVDTEYGARDTAQFIYEMMQCSLDMFDLGDTLDVIMKRFGYKIIY